jgi:hypothetical protein
MTIIATKVATETSFLWGYNGSGIPMRTDVTIVSRTEDNLFTFSFDFEAPREADALSGEVDNGDGTWTASSFGGTFVDRKAFVAPASFNWLD